MDFKQLETLVAIVKHNSYTRAAQELFLTQPALSSHIQALESELGTVVFNRSGKNVTLTDAGRILYNYAVNIINMREQAFYSMAQYEGRLEGELAIASSNAPQNFILPGLLKEFSDSYPQITYVIRQFDSKGVIDSILDGEIDFGFVGTSGLQPGLEMIEICSDRLVLIAPIHGRLGDYDQDYLSWDQVQGERFILRERGSATRKRFEEALEGKQIRLKDLKVIAEMENAQTIKQCVAVGLGVSVVSERSVLADIQNGLFRAFHIQDLDMERQFYFISHSGRVFSPLARAFRDFVIQRYRK